MVLVRVNEIMIGNMQQVTTKATLPIHIYKIILYIQKVKTLIFLYYHNL